MSLKNIIIYKINRKNFKQNHSIQQLIKIINRPLDVSVFVLYLLSMIIDGML